MGLFGVDWGDLTGFALGGPSWLLNRGIFNPGSGGNDMPYQPNRTAPDFAPNYMFSNFTNWQNKKRNNMLADFYGGKVYKGNGSIPSEPDVDYPNPMDYLNEHTQGRDADYSTPMDYLNEHTGGTQEDAADTIRDLLDEANIGRTSVHFKGNKPAQEWRNAQRTVVNKMDRNFEGDLEDYFAKRGIQDDSSVEGAGEEQAKDFDLIRKNINARARSIKQNTIGQLFGEVSDAGAAAGQLAGQVGQTSNMFNQQAQDQFGQLMQKYQWDRANQQPGLVDRMAGAAGQFLPFMMMGGSGFKQPASTYPLSPGVSNTSGYGRMFETSYNSPGGYSWFRPEDWDVRVPVNY